MYSYSLSQWILFFVLYCLVGWCIESTFVSVQQKHFVNRGFLSGPVIPIYGFGALGILFAALPVRNSIVLVFLLGALAASMLEYATGAAMEAIFGVRYWDYSENRWNLNGHICLGTSLAWGLLSVILLRVLHPFFETVLFLLPSSLTSILALVLAMVMAADVSSSVKTALDIKALLQQMERYSEKAKEDLQVLQRRVEITATFRLDAVENFLTEKLAELPPSMEGVLKKLEDLETMVERLEQTQTVQTLKMDLAMMRAHRTASLEQLKARLSRGHRSMLRNNPSARSRRYAEQMKLLHEDGKEEYKVEK